MAVDSDLVAYKWCLYDRIGAPGCLPYSTASTSCFVTDFSQEHCKPLSIVLTSATPAILFAKSS